MNQGLRRRVGDSSQRRVGVGDGSGEANSSLGAGWVCVHGACGIADSAVDADKKVFIPEKKADSVAV